MKNLTLNLYFLFMLIYIPAFGQSGVHQHDGFFLRMVVGIGYAQLNEDNVMGSDLKFSGSSGASRLQIGGTVTDNLIIYGEFGGIIQTEPTMEWMGSSQTATDVSASVYDFGGGLTYYMMPENLYFSLSLLVSQVELEYSNSKGESEYGFGLNALLGKEWWVSNDWALGVALYGYYSTMKDKGVIETINYEYTFNNFSIGALFSVTFN